SHPLPPSSPHPSPPSYSTPSFLLFQPPKPEDHRPDFSPTTEKSRPTRALRFCSFFVFHCPPRTAQLPTLNITASLTTFNTKETNIANRLRHRPGIKSNQVRPLLSRRLFGRRGHRSANSPRRVLPPFLGLDAAARPRPLPPAWGSRLSGATLLHNLGATGRLFSASPGPKTLFSSGGPLNKTLLLPRP
ncbi:hypothetical protein CCUS01_03374, partial [Colletotrichum cuscutae]